MTVNNDIHTTIYALNQILDNQPPTRATIKLSGITFGKIVKGYPLQSKTKTLTPKEVTRFTRQLMSAYKNWATYGHEKWTAKEVKGIRFTILFRRKGTEEGRPLDEIYQKPKKVRK